MIAEYSDREFQLWEYRVSHGSLLIRSPKGSGRSKNIDLEFVGVVYLSAPRFLRGIRLERGRGRDRRNVRRALGDRSVDDVFVLVSNGRRHLIAAATCKARETDDDIFDSPFIFRTEVRHDCDRMS